MQLNSKEELLLNAYRRLPPAAAAEISALAQRLAALGPEANIDWSDSWSDEDLQEFTAPRCGGWTPMIRKTRVETR